MDMLHPGEQEETFNPDIKSNVMDHAWLCSQWYEEDLWDYGDEPREVLEEHKMAITWAYMWYWGFIKADPIPEALHPGLWNAYAHILDLYGKDPYNDTILNTYELEK